MSDNATLLGSYRLLSCLLMEWQHRFHHHILALCTFIQDFHLKKKQRQKLYYFFYQFGFRISCQPQCSYKNCGLLCYYWNMLLLYKWLGEGKEKVNKQLILLKQKHKASSWVSEAAGHSNICQRCRATVLRSVTGRRSEHARSLVSCLAWYANRCFSSPMGLSERWEDDFIGSLPPVFLSANSHPRLSSFLLYLLPQSSSSSSSSSSGASRIAYRLPLVWIS